MAWFMMMYASNTIANLIAGPTRPRDLGGVRGLTWAAWLAALGAMAMTAWDLAMDPQSSTCCSSVGGWDRGLRG
jgi:hypothetical protein